MVKRTIEMYAVESKKIGLNAHSHRNFLFAFQPFLIVDSRFLQFEFEEVLGIRNYSPAAASIVSPAFGATASGLTYFATSGPRVAVLAGSIGFGAVAATYTLYSLLGIPYGSRGFLFF